MNSNQKKNAQLQMSYGKAQNILRKSIMFDLIKKCNLDICFRCNKKIKDIKNLSVEHKKAWLNSENPVELFFDLDNITFSHLKCNCSNHSHYLSDEGRKRISEANKGENKKSSKLTRELVEEIRSRYKNSLLSYREIAKEYNVTHQTIENIVNFKIWK